MRGEGDYTTWLRWPPTRPTRTDDIGATCGQWGMHLIDANVAMGDIGRWWPQADATPADRPPGPAGQHTSRVGTRQPTYQVPTPAAQIRAGQGRAHALRAQAVSIMAMARTLARRGMPSPARWSRTMRPDGRQAEHPALEPGAGLGEAGRGEHEEPGRRQPRHDDADAAEDDREPPDGEQADPAQHDRYPIRLAKSSTSRIASSTITDSEMAV